MKKFFILLTVAFFVMGLVTLAISATEPAGKVKVTVTGKKTTEFDHAAHKTRAGGDCQFCHHKNEKGQGGKCGVCHTETGKDKAIPAKDAFHKTCKKCHVDGGKAKVRPNGCKGCHD